MTGRERDSFEQGLLLGKGKVNLENVRARLCALTVVDDTGARLFKDKDVTELGNKSAAALDRVYEVAQRLNRISGEDVEELEKNSGKIRSEDSASD